MSDSEFKIRITTAADLRAAKAAEAELRKQIVAAKAAGLAYSGLDANLRRVQASIGGMGFFGRAKNELLGLAERVPVLGSLMRSLNGAVGPASAAAAAIGGAGVAAAGLAATFIQGVRAAASMGDELSDLSARTGAPIKDLVVLRQALDNAGVGAGSAGPMINLLQKALAGVNEEGEPTAKVFADLGLSVTTLANLSPLDALKEISKALQGMENPAQRTAAAMKMFSRSGGEMLPVLLDPDAISKAQKQTGKLGEVMQANATKFGVFADAMDSTGTKGMQFFASAAAELAPLLERIGTAMDGIDLSGLGQEVGRGAAGFVALAKRAADAGREIKKITQWLPGNALAEMVTRRIQSLGNDQVGPRLKDQMHPALPGVQMRETVTDSPNVAPDAGGKWRQPQPADAAPGPTGGSSATTARTKYEEYFTGAADDRETRRAMEAARQTGDTGQLRSRLQESLDRSREITGKPDAERTEADYAELQALDRKITAYAEVIQSIEREAAERRASLQLETQIHEARAAGNADEQARLEWMREYNALLASGSDHAEAARAVNAKTAAAAADEAAAAAKRAEQGRQTLADEQAQIDILRLRAAGQNSLADAAERELRARQLTRQYTEAGASPADAAAMAAERARLEAAPPAATPPAGGVSSRRYDIAGRDISNSPVNRLGTTDYAFTDFASATAPRLADALRAPGATAQGKGSPDKLAGATKSLEDANRAIAGTADAVDKLGRAADQIESSVGQIVDKIGSRLTTLEKKVESMSRNA